MSVACVQGRKALVLAGVMASLLISVSSPAEAARRKKGGNVYAPPYSSMVVDVKTGRVLHAENEDALRYPASITKVMTLYMLFEQLERGKLGLDTPLPVSARAAAQAPSKLGLDPGETIEVEDAIKALVTKSANDVAVVVAESLGGTEDEFAEQMTRKARQLGMSRTVFRNASGLPDSEQVTTARDLTILARAIQERFPRYYRYFQTRTFNFAGVSHRNHNKLLGRVEGVDGIKTGFTNASGFNLMTNAKTDDRHIVAVVLGGRSGASRDQAMASLVKANLPRAFAGSPQASAVAEAAPVPAARPVIAEAAPVPVARPATSEAVPVSAARPVAVADAAGEPMQLQPQVHHAPAPAVAAAPAPTTTPQATASVAPAQASATTTPQARKPLDLNSLRPVVASAAGASTTTTPSSLPPMRWQTGPQPLPSTVQAYASMLQEQPAPARPVPATPAAVGATKADERSVAQTVVAKAEPVAEAKTARPGTTPWVIQVGTSEDEAKAKTILDNAKSRTGRALARASAFTEKVSKDGSTLYRARFSGFSESDEAEAACKVLKRNGFACFATRS